MIINVRKLPVIVQAIQWTGDNLGEVIDFTGKHPKWSEWFKDWDEYEAHVKADNNIFKILTSEGTMSANVGDWIMRGVNGEHYPCKPDIFNKTYVIVDNNLDTQYINDIKGLIFNIDRTRTNRNHSLAVTKLEEAQHWLEAIGK